MKLFTYCIPIDDGAAPNPFWGVCTLVICKPAIRRVAQIGDWIAGFGSKNVEGIDYSGKLVYAMKVTQAMSISEYDKYCKLQLVNKIPDITNPLYERRVGDCIYDFNLQADGKLLPSVHSHKNRKTDLGGQNALLSTHYYYFGNNAMPLPEHLHEIINQGRGHKSNSNEPYKHSFVEWIENFGYHLNELHGSPQIRVDFKNIDRENEGTVCGDIRCKSDFEDEELALS